MEGDNNINQSSNPTPTPSSSSSSTSAPQLEAAPSGDKRMIMGILAYIGILVIIPFLMAKDDSFVHFHIKQGLVLVVLELIIWVLGMTYIFYDFNIILSIVNIILIVLSIVGIVNVVQGKEKELPVLGQFSRFFNNI